MTTTRRNDAIKLLLLLVTLLIGVTSALPPRTRHAVLAGKRARDSRKSHPTRSIGTLFTFKRPTANRVARWFENVKDSLEFNHDSVGMTNPCLHISLNDDDQAVIHVSGRADEDLADAWWPAPCNTDKVDNSWRVLRYRCRIGEGQQCYDKVRDAALDWEFGNEDEKGILRVCHSTSKRRMIHTRHDARGEGYEVVHNVCDGDGDFALTDEVGQRVRQIWSGPHGGRRLVTYSAAHAGGTTKEKVRFRWPRLYAVSPVMVVYDLVDQRGPGTTYTSTAYATLKGHLLSGEERVTVALRDDMIGGGYVDVEILSYSRPGPSLLGRLAWPLIGPMQSKFFDSQMDAFERVAAAAEASERQSRQEEDPVVLMEERRRRMAR